MSRLPLLLVTAFSAVGCGADPVETSRRSSRADKYRSGGEASPGAGDPAPGEGTAADGAPIQTVNADELEAAAQPERTPIGTRGHQIRCQAAVGEAGEVFAPSWYAYDDRKNPGTPIEGCEEGHSESVLEALPWGEGRTSLCSIGWHAMLREGSTWPYTGMGVRTAGGLEGVRSVTIETRSTGKPFAVTAHLIMEQQELLPCGDEAKAPYEERVLCDGTGNWNRQTLSTARFAPTWGAPGPLDLKRVVSLHFQNLPNHEGTLDCDVRIVAVDRR